MIGSTMISPTRRLLLIGGLGPVLCIGLLAVDMRLWPFSLLFVAGLVLAVAVDVLAGFRARHLNVSTNPPGALYVGEQGTLGIRLTGTRIGAAIHVDALTDVDDKIDPPSGEAIVLNRHGSGTLEVALRPIRRGDARIAAIWTRWMGPLGLTWRVRRDDVDLKFPVLPNLPAVRRAALILNRRGSRIGIKPELARGAGSEFEALRDFVAGMDRRSIDWKHSARHHKLISKEYRTERNHAVILAIDCGHVMREPIDGIPKIDHAINAALVLAYQGLAEGDRVGVFGFDAEPQGYCAPQAGHNAFARIQHTLSSFDYSMREPNFTFAMTRLMGELRQPSIVIILTDLLDSVSAELMIESVAHLARRHVVMFTALADPALGGMENAPPHAHADVVRSVVASDLMRERREVLERLRRARVDAFDVAPRDLDSSLLSRYIAIKERATVVR